MTFDWMRLRHDPQYRAILISEVRSNEDVRTEGRAITKTNLLALSYVLGYTKIDPIVHKEAIEFFIPRDPSKPVDKQGEGQKTRGTLLYPRGTYKTTLDEVDCVQDVLCFPFDGVLFVMCANQKLADALVDNAGMHFVLADAQRPTLLQALYPELCVNLPKGGSFSGRFDHGGKRQMEPPIKESSIMAFSAEAGVSGWHCWRFKCDDMANNRNMRSANSQADVDRNYNINRKMLMPGGIEDKMGTRYGPFDPYGMELSKVRANSMRYIVKPALRRLDGARLDPNGFPRQADIELLFEPLGLTYEYLRTEYEADYSSFMTQFMNDAHGANEVIFTPEELGRVSRDEDDMPLGGATFIAWRLPARGLGFSVAAAAVGIMENGRMHIVDAVHGQFRPSAQAVRIVQLSKHWGQSQIEIEETPGARHFEPAIRNYALTLGWPISIQWTPHEEASDRDLRIKALEPKISTSRVILSRDLSVGTKLFQQLTTYGMMDDNALPDVVSRVCSHLPTSIALDDDDGDASDLAWDAMKQRDMYNRLHGAGDYAAPEPEPEDATVDEEISAFTIQPNPWGFDEEMPGLMG